MTDICTKPDGTGFTIFVRIFNYALVIAAGVAFLSCSGNGGIDQPDSAATTPGVGAGGFALPAPGELRQLSYLPGDLVRTGAQYVADPGYPAQNLTVDGDTCMFAPDWAAPATSAAGLAYACYAFELEGYDLSHIITTAWSQAGSADDLWFGLADWSRNCWEWHRPAVGVLETDLAPFINGATHQMLVVVLMTGTDSWQLDTVKVGDPASIEGFVYQADGTTPLYDAEVVCSGPNTYSARTDNLGHWSVPCAVSGDYTVSAHLVGWEFVPASRDVSVASPGAAVEGFTGSQLPTYKVNGYVYDSSSTGEGLRGAEIAVTRQDDPAGGVSAWTDFDGYWALALPDGDYTATASLAGYEFTPESQSLAVSEAGCTADPFYGTKLPGYTVDGYIFQTDGITPMPDIQVNVSGNELYYNTRTNLNGYWFIGDIPDGGYTATPFEMGWEFAPESRDFTISGADLRLEQFTGAQLPRYEVDGYILLDDNVTPLANSPVQLSGYAGWYTTSTDGNGHYSFADIYEGDYGVAPQDIRYEFTPAEYTFYLGGDLTLDPFLATVLPTYEVDGHVFRPDGETPVPDVEVTIWSFMSKISFNGKSDAEGHWVASGVPAGFYNATPLKQGYTFEPSGLSFTITDTNLTIDNFIGSAPEAYLLDGYIYELDESTPVPDVQVRVFGTQYQYIIYTDSAGYWIVDEAFEDSYSITPTLSPWVFSPPYRSAVVSGGDLRVEHFIGEEQEAYMVDGYVYEGNSTIPVPDIEVICDNRSTMYYCYTDETGHYEVPLPNGDWNVWPNAGCWDFVPAIQDITVAGMPQTLQIFYAWPGG